MRRRFWRDTQAQDLVEYTFLLALISIAMVSLLIAAGGSTSAVWAAQSEVWTQAATVSPPPPSPAPAPAPALPAGYADDDDGH